VDDQRLNYESLLLLLVKHARAAGRRHYADGLHQPAPATVYARAGVETWPNGSTTVRRAVTFAIRSSRAGSAAVLKEVAAAVYATNPSLPLAQVSTLGDAYRQSMARMSFTVVLLSIASAMALTLSIVGVYGVLAYSVSSGTSSAKWAMPSSRTFPD